jgi:hypothetical protein
VPRPFSSSRKPFSRIQSSLKIFEMYFDAPSAEEHEDVLGFFSFFAYLIAPATAAPPEPPTKRPSAHELARHQEALLVVDADDLVEMLRFIVEGKKSSPMPSTL